MKEQEKPDECPTQLFLREMRSLQQAVFSLTKAIQINTELIRKTNHGLGQVSPDVDSSLDDTDRSKPGVMA